MVAQKLLLNARVTFIESVSSAGAGLSGPEPSQRKAVLRASCSLSCSRWGMSSLALKMDDAEHPSHHRRRWTMSPQSVFLNAIFK